MQFSKKELAEGKRVCFKLKELREQKKISKKQMSEKIRMSESLITALESCNFDELPFSVLYQKKMIRSYLKILDTDPEPYLQQFTFEELKPRQRKVDPKRVKTSPLFVPNYPVIFKVAGVSAFLLVFVSYLLFQVNRIVEPPALLVFSPETDFTTSNPTLLIQGKTDREAQIQINGNDIMNTEDGFFEETIHLTEGVNTIVFSSKKKHGKVTVETRHIVYKTEPTLTTEKITNL